MKFYLTILIGCLLQSSLVQQKQPLFPKFSTYYQTGKWELEEAQKENIKTYVISHLKTIADSQYIVRIEGHADVTGSKKANVELSGKRAETIATFLISNGIPESRIIKAHFGSSIPNRSASKDFIKKEDILYNNRRVEIIIEPLH